MTYGPSRVPGPGVGNLCFYKPFFFNCTCPWVCVCEPFLLPLKEMNPAELLTRLWKILIILSLLSFYICSNQLFMPMWTRTFHRTLIKLSVFFWSEQRLRVKCLVSSLDESLKKNECWFLQGPVVAAFACSSIPAECGSPRDLVLLPAGIVSYYD